MMTKKSWAIAVVALLVAFGAGWLGAKLMDLDKMSLGQVYAGRWFSAVEMLVGQPRSLKFNDPDTIKSLIGTGLDIDSIELARHYDDLSPQWKSRVVFLLPAARAIAAKGQKSRVHYGGAITTFVNCVEQVQAHGGSVNACTRARKIWAQRGVNYALLPIHLTGGPPRQLPSASTSR